MEKLSLIIPCYNEQEALGLFYDEATQVCEKLKTKYDIAIEMLFVDDGSKDTTLKLLKQLALKDEAVKYLSFSKNFGKEAAMFAGLQNVTGDYVALLDCDLQDPPALLDDMLDAIKNENYDCVATRRVTRKGEPPIRSFFAKMFYKLINAISKVEIVDGARDFRLMTRQMVNSILKMQEYNRFSKGIFAWVGFNTKYMEYENVNRVAGDTKWSFFSLLKYSFEGIYAFTTVPLAIGSFVGILFCIISFILALVYFVKTLAFGESAAGFPTLICSLFMIGGLQLFCIGIMGQYIARMYLEIKNRPIYIAKEDNLYDKATDK